MFQNLSTNAHNIEFLVVYSLLWADKKTLLWQCVFIIGAKTKPFQHCQDLWFSCGWQWTTNPARRSIKTPHQNSRIRNPLISNPAKSKHCLSPCVHTAVSVQRGWGPHLKRHRIKCKQVTDFLSIQVGMGWVCGMLSQRVHIWGDTIQVQASHGIGFIEAGMKWICGMLCQRVCMTLATWSRRWHVTIIIVALAGLVPSWAQLTSHTCICICVTV